MLADNPIDVMLTASDVAAAKEFYGDPRVPQLVVTRLPERGG